MPKRSDGTPRSRKSDGDDLATIFGANFRNARLKENLSQADVSARTGIQQHYISEIENGIQNPTLRTMVTLAQALGTDVQTLLKQTPGRR